MKTLPLLILSGSVCVVICLCGPGLSSCTKTTTIHDTTTVNHTDTLTVRDTTVINDTVVVNDTVLNRITNGLIAYYNFNGGNLNDSSGHSNNIIFNNATPTVDRFGNANNAYLFNGNGSYMQVANSASLNPNNITMYAIIKPLGFYQGTCHGNRIINKGIPDDVSGFYTMTFEPSFNGTGGVCASIIDSTKEIFGGGFGDNIPQGAAAGAPGISMADSVYVEKYQWYTLVYTYDGTTAKFYVNGALASSVPNPGPVTFTPNSADVYIGKTASTTYPYYFNGVIDEIRIYNRALTAQEVGYLGFSRTKYIKTPEKVIY